MCKMSSLWEYQFPLPPKNIIHLSSPPPFTTVLTPQNMFINHLLFINHLPPTIMAKYSHALLSAGAHRRCYWCCYCCWCCAIITNSTKSTSNTADSTGQNIIHLSPPLHSSVNPPNMFINHLSPTIMANYSHDDTTTIGRWCTFKPGTTTQPPYRTLALKVHGCLSHTVGYASSTLFGRIPSGGQLVNNNTKRLCIVQ
jgi:hypothetical protein